MCAGEIYTKTTMISDGERIKTGNANEKMVEITKTRQDVMSEPTTQIFSHGVEASFCFIGMNSSYGHKKSNGVGE